MEDVNDIAVILYRDIYLNLISLVLSFGRFGPGEDDVFLPRKCRVW